MNLGLKHVGIGLFLSAMSASASLYIPPVGGWLHAYDGSVDPTTVGWAHNNGSDAWDGSGLSSGVNGGGAEVQTQGGDTYWRISDRLSGGSPNQKIFFHRVLSEGLPVDPLAPGGPGVTIHLRSRLPTQAVGNGFFANPDGFPPSSGQFNGAGMFEVFTGDRGNPDTTKAIGLSLHEQGGLKGIWLNGAADGGSTHQVIPLADVTAWQEVWATVAPISGTTHEVNLYLNGSTTALTYTVDSGGHNIEGSSVFTPSIGMGVPSTGGQAEFDVDFFNVSFGTFVPVSVPEPSVAVLIFLGALGLHLRRRR